MGETSDLIGIYGAIDRAVAADAGRRAPVSRLLPAYRRAGSDAHWFDDFERWTNRKRAEDAGEPFPSLDQALRERAGVPARGRMRARRLFAIAVAVQAFPERFGAEGELTTLAQSALHAEGLAVGEEQAERLLELLGDEMLLPDIDDQIPGALDVWWRSLLVVASVEGLIADAEGMGPRPCSGRLVTVDLPGGGGPVATLRTEFETATIDFERAVKFLNPETWPKCNDFWCEVTKLAPKAPGVHRYHEVVSTDCQRKSAVWTIEAHLDFRFREFANVAMADYRLAEGHPQEGDDVLVDEGSLVVQRLVSAGAPRLRITTTKRVKFAWPFGGEALALMMCALGYASVAEDLVYTCATLGAAGDGTALPEPAPADVLGPDPAVTALQDCLDECADALAASSRKMAKRSYDADALVQDMASGWVRMLREGAIAADLGVRSVRTATRTRTRGPTGG